MQEIEATRNAPALPLPVDKWEPTDVRLWERVLNVAKGKKREMSRRGPNGLRTIHAPNHGRGFRRWPSPKATAWAVKQYKGFGGRWRGQDEAEVTASFLEPQPLSIQHDVVLTQLRMGSVMTTREGVGLDDLMVSLEGRGLVAEVHTNSDRLETYWDITAAGFKFAGLKQDLLEKVQDLKTRGQSYADDDQFLSSQDQQAIADFVKWFRANFRIDSAKTPRGMKPLKEAAITFLKAMEIYGQPGGRTYARALMHLSLWDHRIAPYVDDLVQGFTGEGDISKGKKEEIVEIKGSHALFFNRANMSEINFKKYQSRVDTFLGTLRGWRTKSLSGTLKVVFVGAQQMKSQGKYKRDLDELWILATPRVLNRDNGYGSSEYITIHELGHRYERFHHPSTDFDKPSWWTSRYSRNEGESFAELFAIGHYMMKGPWDEAIVNRFEEVMS